MKMKKVKNRKLPPEVEAKMSDLKDFMFRLKFVNLLLQFEYFRNQFIRFWVSTRLIEEREKGLLSLYDLYVDKEKNEKK